MTYNFDFRDLSLSVANYFAKKDKMCIKISFEKSIEIFSKPFNLIAFSKEGETNGIMIVHYEEQLQESIENGLPLNSGLATQKTWICMESSMLEKNLELLDEQTGILLYKKNSRKDYQIKEYRNASKMHEYPFPNSILFDLLSIQSTEYWRLRNFEIKKALINKI